MSLKYNKVHVEGKKYVFVYRGGKKVKSLDGKYFRAEKRIKKLFREKNFTLKKNLDFRNILKFLLKIFFVNFSIFF